jgi:hypothetical protein
MKKNALKTNTNKEAIDSLILNTQQNKSEVLCWRIIGKDKYVESSIIRVIRKSKNELVIKSTGNNDVFYNQIISGTSYLNVYIPSEIMLFRSKIKSITNEGEVLVEYPEIMAHVDRRKYLRIKIEKGAKISFVHDKSSAITGEKKERLEFDISELSANGCQIEVPQGQAHIFKHLEKVSEVKINFQGHDYLCDIDLKNIVYSKDDDSNQAKKKISFELLEMASEVREDLDKKLFELSDIPEDVFN